MKKIQCCQSYRSHFDNFEDSVSIIVVDPFQKNDALGEVQDGGQQKVSQAWQHDGVSGQHHYDGEAVQNYSVQGVELRSFLEAVFFVEPTIQRQELEVFHL